MAKKERAKVSGSADPAGALALLMAPVVAAELAGVIYQAKLANRQAKLNIPESEVVSDVVTLWRAVLDSILPPRK